VVLTRIAGIFLALALVACQGGGEAGFYNDEGIKALSQDRYDEALKSFKKALEMHPDDGVVWGNAGVALVRMERYEEALEAYAKSDELEPNDPITVYELGGVYYRMRRFAEAEVDYRRAIELEARVPMFHSSLSLALLHQGKDQEAEAAMATALPFVEKRGVVRYQLAATHLIRGDVDQGLDEFEKSLERHPMGARDSVGDADFGSVHEHPRYQKLVGGWWKSPNH